jgi:hypothetical protein
MTGSMVADLGLGPDVWLFLTLLSFLTLFFKFSRFWSIRNLDLLLLFAPAPGLMRLIMSGPVQPWGAFVWLFVAAGLWLFRCLIDLGLNRRPLLEPNLNGAGLSCVAVGMLVLLVTETINLPVNEGAARNPADSGAKTGTRSGSLPGATDRNTPINQVLRQAPLPPSLKFKPPQVIFSRVLASVAHLGLVTALIAIGSRHFERTIAGLAVASCYLLSPYTRIALVDSGQVVPAAMVVAAILLYNRPAAAAALVGLAAGWMPACLGLIPLWTGFYRDWRGLRFISISIAVVLACALVAWAVPGMADWARALGARSLAEAGLLPSVEAPPAGSFWTRIDPSYRLPALIGYVAFVLVLSVWPAGKNLGQLIALSAAVLIASQFWYLDEGGTLVLLYLPLILLMMFRPNLAAKRAIIPSTPPKTIQKAFSTDI